MINYYKATGRGLIHKLCRQKLNVLSLCRMIRRIERANGVQTHFQCFRLVFQTCACVQTQFECFKMVERACANCQRRKSLSHVCKEHICSSQYLNRVYKEEQPRSKCVLNSLLSCMSISNRADKNSPTKVNFDIYVSWVHNTSNHK